jgi:hypothetical protein
MVMKKVWRVLVFFLAAGGCWAQAGAAQELAESVREADGTAVFRTGMSKSLGPASFNFSVSPDGGRILFKMREDGHSPWLLDLKNGQTQDPRIYHRMMIERQSFIIYQDGVAIVTVFLHLPNPN